MKKIIITSTLVFFAMIIQAQYFLGGSLQLNHTSIESKQGPQFDRESYSNFSFAPMFGHQTGKFAFGTGFVFSSRTHIETIAIFEPWWGWREYDVKIESTLWGIQPFVRYTFAEFGNFSIFANIRLHLLGGYRSYPVSNIYDYLTFSSSSFDERQRSPHWPPHSFPSSTDIGITAVGINITPVLSYNLSEHLSLEATLNFMNFGLNRLTQEHKSSEDKRTVTNFGFGVNFENAANVSALSIGFILKLQSF
jgi:hypothetical protein